MRCRLAHGFTMIELMVVLIIVAILAAIAIPSYQESVLKTRRTEGRAALMKAMQQQERYYSLHTTYLAFSSSSTDAEAKKFSWFSGANAKTSFYEISAQACNGKTIRDCVLLIAQPGTVMVNSAYRDPLCGTMSLNSRGEKSAAADRCW
ncbi:type IV pilin protein [Herminiimonas fonticola]|uniref:type IV pilin protein n=1 Tax=Herminiimonas fonticola TaxID=303380 RepID=UPI0033415B09